jgi:hypothetical protein
VASEKQRVAVRESITKAHAGALSKRTIAHLHISIRTELAKQANRVRRAG